MGLGGISIKNSLPDTSLETMQDKLLNLKKPFLKSFNPTVESRKDRIRRIVKLIEENSENIHKAISKDFGSRHEQLSQLTDTLSTITAKHALKNIRKWIKPEKRNPNFPLGLLGSKAYVQSQPYGVVGIIAPWNFPLNLSLAPLVEIFAAGNNAMMKLSEFVPATSELTEVLINKYFKPDEVRVVNGGPKTSQVFSGLAFDHLLFTGSTSVAKKIAFEAAANLVPLTLELGGKSASVISTEAKMKKSVDKIIMGKLFNAGQICIAPDYIFVPENKEQEFVESVRVSVAEMYPTIKDNEDYTSIINERHFDRINSLITDAKEKGAEIIQINPANEDFDQQEHHKIPPTIILNVTDEMDVMQNEIFGPIFPVVKYKNFNETIKYINRNSGRFHLNGENKEEIDDLLNKTTTGQMVINEVMFQFSMHDLPFGGVGPSGSGAYHGKDGYLNFSHKRAILKGQNVLNAGKLVSAPYTEKTKKNIKLF